MMPFDDFFHKHKIKNKATSKITNQQVLLSLSLNVVGIFLKDEPFETDIGIVNLNPSKGTHWVANLKEKFFDSCGFPCRSKTI